jgi:threonine/homoserine/homoserine lactone efflux protein
MVDKAKYIRKIQCQGGFMFSWLSFLSYTAIMAYTPGPINIMSMNNVKNIGLTNSILFNFGNYAGHYFVMLECLAFSKILFAILPQIQFPMKIMGAIYLAYLIVKTIMPSSKERHTKESKKRNFIVGALLQLINVKVILFGLTVMTSYLLPYFKNIPVLILFCLLMSSIQFTGNVCWTLFGTLLDKIFKSKRILLNILMSIMLLYCIIRLFI